MIKLTYEFIHLTKNLGSVRPSVTSISYHVIVRYLQESIATLLLFSESQYVHLKQNEFELGFSFHLSFHPYSTTTILES